MPFLEHQGERLYYERHGTGPAVVFAHGIGGNHATWYRQIPRFAHSYEVVTFDQRGFGRSTDIAARGRSAFVDDLEALLDALALRRVALVGQSMGGGTCVGFAARRPERVAALVLADTLHGFVEPPEVEALMNEARARTAGLGQLERVLCAATRARAPELASLYSQIASFNAADRTNLAGSFAPLVDPQGFARLRIPTLFLVGAEDPLFPPAAVASLQRLVPGSFYAEVSGAGHSAYFERPDEFDDMVLSFLQAVGYKGVARPAHSNAPGYRPVEPGN